MKIALVQLDASDDKYWSLNGIKEMLSLSGEADLVVFPEAMPFWIEEGKKITNIKTAVKKLCDVGSAGPAFIAGGYVMDDVKDAEVIRNAAFLVHNGQLCGEYFKRIMWQDEKTFSSGPCGVKFSWSHFSCIPLICADAGDDSSQRTTTMMMREATMLGANHNTPIIVPSYGAGLMTEYWRSPLTRWSQACGAPVAICGVSGKSKEMYTEDKKRKHYGGGGSGVFWPDGTHTQQSKERGIYIIDLWTREQKFVAI